MGPDPRAGGGLGGSGERGGAVCTQQALAAAVNAANVAGGGTINLIAGCDYALTSADNGENGLPVVMTKIGVNGNGATIDGTGAVRVFEVDGPVTPLRALSAAGSPTAAPRRAPPSWC
jgi:hypothetical protein